MKAIIKTLLTFSILISVTTSVFAQVEKGMVLVGGSVGFEYKGQKDASTINLNILPRAGYFTGKHFMIGLNVGYNFTQEKSILYNGSGAKINVYRQNHGLLIGPIFRPYFKIGDKTALFIHLSPMFGLSENRFGKTVKDSRDITKSLVWQAGTGFNFFVTQNVAIELSVYYQGSYNNNYIKDDNMVIPNTSNKYVLHGVNTNIGFNYFFLVKKKSASPNP